MDSARIDRLAAALRDQGLDALFAHHPITLAYLAGYGEHAGERFLSLAISSTGAVRLIAPALSEAQARRAGIEDIRTWKDGEDPLRHLEELAAEWNLKSAILAVDDELPAKMLLEMQGTLPAALFKPGGPVVSELMRTKSEAELDLLQRAADIADAAWDEVHPSIRAGMTEVELSDLLAQAMKKRGGTPTFSIVAAGPNGAEPHHLSDTTPIRHGDVLICDFGCELEGYQSDITRTVAVGEASEKAQQVYALVYAAHMAGRHAVKLGELPEKVDAAARQVIVDGGYGPYFYHRLGHGIGMRGHEAPNLVQGNTDPLRMGDCFSVEPGIYLEGEFGVRIENILTVDASGGRSFNAEPSPTLLVVG